MSTNLNGFEALEDRVLLAGNVTVAFNAAGDVVVTGDSASNQIEIQDLDGDGSYTIVGLNGTTVNYSAAVVAADIFDADDADNGVFGAGAVAGDTFIVNLGKGNDELFVTDAGFGGDIGAGVNLTVNMGTGNDLVDVLGAGGTVFDHVNIDLGAGNDELILNDFIATSVSVSGAAGNDEITLVNFVADSVGVSGGAGSDLIGVGFAGIDTLSVNGGAGKDGVQLDGVFVNHAKITLGGNHDGASITNSVFDLSFTLKGGGGKDNVEIGNSDFNGVNRLHGNGGKDFLHDLGGNNFSNDTKIKSFKIV